MNLQLTNVFCSVSAERPSLILKELAAQIKSGLKVTEAHIDKAVARAEREAQSEISKANANIAAAQKQGAALKAKLKSTARPVPPAASGNAVAKGLTRVGKEGQARFSYESLRVVPNSPCTGWLIGTGRREVLYITTQQKSLMKSLQRKKQDFVEQGKREDAEYVGRQLKAIEALTPHLPELKALRATIPGAARQRLKKNSR